jgi:hypothetical protein
MLLGRWKQIFSKHWSKGLAKRYVLRVACCALIRNIAAFHYLTRNSKRVTRNATKLIHPCANFTGHLLP